MEGETRVPAEPLDDLWMLMGRVVGEDHVD